MCRVKGQVRSACVWGVLNAGILISPPLTTHRTRIGHALDTHRICIGHSPDTHWTCTEHSPDTHQTRTGHAPDTHDTHRTRTGHMLDTTSDIAVQPDPLPPPRVPVRQAQAHVVGSSVSVWEWGALGKRDALSRRGGQVNPEPWVALKLPQLPAKPVAGVFASGGRPFHSRAAWLSVPVVLRFLRGE